MIQNQYFNVKNDNYNSINVIEITGSTTYNKPSNLLYARVVCVGGGGGGGSGRSANGQSYGGGSGGGGALASRILLNSELSVSETITIGSGGTGGAATINANGIDGVNGGNTSFGFLVIAEGGKKGLKGVVTTPAPVGGSGGLITNSTPNQFLLSLNGMSGVQGTASGPLNNNFVSASLYAGCSGGGGSGFVATFLQWAGGTGGYVRDKNGVETRQVGGAAGGGSGNNGNDNVALQIIEEYPYASGTTKGLGQGGSGGGGSTTAGVNGGNGGDGGLYGAGGGGGGAARYLTTEYSGSGGTGSQGLCIIVEYLK